MRVDGFDVRAWGDWIWNNGGRLPVAHVETLLTTYLRLLGEPTRAIAEAVAGSLIGRDPIPDATESRRAEMEMVRQRLKELADVREWRDASNYFAAGDDR